ncbi:hypothetical protein OIDMADRAFT_46852 [Oidiodendron maius Zn]|uniref:Uncharacterized protein n=1 Tax=Oidiodendron maius (strain Zn) TaxID=913774 RepID=A0A0C3HXI7_OIDMZ|nr:hypothetical protein OIDMADRAFT_46852 [Oidiodendron maius Zn]
MTLTLVRCEGHEDGVEVGADGAWGVRVPRNVVKLSPSREDREALVRELQRTLRETYLRNCDPAAPYQLVSPTIARLVTTGFWLAVHYQLETKGANDSNMALGPNLSASMRDQLFSASFEILELSKMFLTHK